MIYRGTNKKAYDKAKSYPRLIRSPAYKLYKFLDSRRANHNDYSQSKQSTINQIELLKSRNVLTSNSLKLYGTKRSGIYKFRLQLNNAVNPKNKRIIHKLSRNIVDSLVSYTSKKILSLISKSYRIVIDVGMITIYCIQINAEKDKYELIAEVIEGDAKLKDKYLELVPFFKKYVEVFNQILSLCDSLLG